MIRASDAIDDVLVRGIDEMVAGGEIGALLDLMRALDKGHAAAVAITDRIERDRIAQNRTGLSLEGLLAFRSLMTLGDRRTLVMVAEALRGLPCLRHAFHTGAVGWAQIRAIAAEARALPGHARAELDSRFNDLDAIGRMDPDELIDIVRDDVARLRPNLAEKRAVRQIESRFLHVQPAFDGALTGYFELDPEAGATFLEGLESVMDLPRADPDDRNRSTGDTPNSDPSAIDNDLSRADSDLSLADGNPSAGVGADCGQRQWTDPAVRRTRARQRADGLVRLAEGALAGTTASGTHRRPRVRMNVVADIATLTGNDEHARAARLLWQTVGSAPALTPAAIRRLASDADLRFLLTDGGQILGVSAPTATIPTNVRAAIHTRDQGCRFPGCRIPAAWTDLHHVVARQDGGPTTIDNLVALCRRHHVLITQDRWKLTMSSDAVVSVRRGRHSATSDPPALRQRPTDSILKDPGSSPEPAHMFTPT